MPGPARRSREDLSAYRLWFLASIPARISALARAVSGPAGVETWTPDLSPASFDRLGEWFALQVSERSLSPDEREAADRRAGKLPGVPPPDRDLDERTRSLCLDIGMYLGQALVHGPPHATWEQVTSGVRDVDFGQLVLRIPGFGAPLNPVSAAEVIAYKVVAGKAVGRCSLREIYDTWANPERMRADLDAAMLAAGLDPDEIRSYAAAARSRRKRRPARRSGTGGGEES